MDAKFEGVITATVGTQTVDKVNMNFYWAQSGPSSGCGIGNGATSFGVREVYFTPDTSGPVVTVGSPDLADGVTAKLAGTALDASPVTNYTVEIQRPDASTSQFACADRHPAMVRGSAIGPSRVPTMAMRSWPAPAPPIRLGRLAHGRLGRRW